MPAERLVPEPMVKLPFKVMVVVEPPTVRALVFDVVRLLKVCEEDVPLIAWAPVPLKVTVPVPALNAAVRALLVKLPFMVKVSRDWVIVCVYAALIVRLFIVPPKELSMVELVLVPVTLPSVPPNITSVELIGTK